MASKIESRNWSELNAKQGDASKAIHNHFTNPKLSEPTLFCAVCKKPCSKRCLGCFTCYCSKEHQTLDWERHKNSLEHRGVYSDPDTVHVSTLQTNDFIAPHPNIASSVARQKRESSKQMKTALKIAANAQYNWQ